MPMQGRAAAASPRSRLRQERLGASPRIANPPPSSSLKEPL